VKIFFFLLTTTISSDKTMDAAATNLGTLRNGGHNGNGGDERRPSEEGARGSGGKDKGKGKMTEAQEEAKEHEQKEQDRKALEQHHEEAMSQVTADLVAKNEKNPGCSDCGSELSANTERDGGARQGRSSVGGPE
jgi:hypothetical protein